MSARLFTSESVTEGHPDKICDQISDSILDAMLAQDPRSRVAVETMVTTGLVHVAGEVTTEAYVEIPKIVRDTVLNIGYDSSTKGFDGASCGVSASIGQQSPDIAQGVDTAFESRTGGVDPLDKQGAGDQGLMFGYACDDTPELMPLPIFLAHRLAERLTAVRKGGELPYLRPDGKTQVTIAYDGDRAVSLDAVVVSSQHAEDVSLDGMLEPDVAPARHRPGRSPSCRRRHRPAHRRLPRLHQPHRQVRRSVARWGMPASPAARSSSTPTAAWPATVAARSPARTRARSTAPAAYATRWVAKNVVAAGLARRCEVQVAYAIGKAQPVGLYVETFGTETVAGRQDPGRHPVDLRPAARRDPRRRSTCSARSTRRRRPTATSAAPTSTASTTASPGSAPTASRRCSARSRADRPVVHSASPPTPPGSVGSASFGPMTTAGRRGRGGAAGAAVARPPPCAVLAGSPATTRPPSTLPVALVQVDTGLAHLDRPFEYTVPTSMADTAAPGVRVKVRFAGQDLDGFVLERRADAEHLGRLSPLRRVVSPEPVLTPEVLTTARAVADRYAGSLGDVLRLAVPPRHATAEKALARASRPSTRRCPSGRPRAWLPYAVGAGVPVPPHLRRRPHRVAARRAVGGRRRRLAGAARRGGPGCGRGWPRRACSSCPTTATSCGSRRPWSRCSGPGRHTRLTADQGPQARYTAYLKALRGHAAGGRRHPGGGVRAGARPRPGRLVGRRRRPARRAARALPARARGAARPGRACTAPAVLSAGFARSVAVADLVAREALTAGRGASGRAAPRGAVGAGRR